MEALMARPQHRLSPEDALSRKRDQARPTHGIFSHMWSTWQHAVLLVTPPDAPEFAARLLSVSPDGSEAEVHVLDNKTGRVIELRKIPWWPANVGHVRVIRADSGTVGQGVSLATARGNFTV